MILSNKSSSTISTTTSSTIALVTTIIILFSTTTKTTTNTDAFSILSSPSSSSSRMIHSSRSSFSSSSFSSSQVVQKQRTSLLASSGGGNFFRKRKSNNNNDDNNNDNNNKEEEDYDYDDDDDDDDDDDEEEESLYEQFASSEFLSNESQITQSSTTTNKNNKPIDWGGEYDTLRNRFNDVKNNKIGPSNTLFRMLTSQTPNEAIMSFINDASPQIITAMSSTVTNLLGGLTNPSTGMEMIIKANGEKLGSLCFQLQMTGYMFRNAEYVLAIRDLMNIDGQASIQDYKNAFDKLDSDKSGYIEANEVYDLLSDVYGDDNIPSFEVDAFLTFFDSNNDGKISWSEFERGLGVVADTKAKESRRKGRTTATAALPGSTDNEEDDDDDDDDDDIMLDSTEPNISGKVKIEMKNGRVIEVEAKEYIEELKREAEALKAALRRERSTSTPSLDQDESQNNNNNNFMQPMGGNADQNTGIAGYIASLGGDLESLTKGISPEVVDAMKMLIDFVLDGGPSGRGKERKNDKELEMEIPSSALQQLALWQLVLGYKLREAEATGEYKKMLE